jgi:hypothetical protein
MNTSTYILQKGRAISDPAFLYNLITQASLDCGRVFLGYRESSPNPKWLHTHIVACDIGKEASEY